jgi:hypothetical protein
MIGAGLAGCGPSQPWPTLDQLHFTAPTERTPSRGSASKGQPFVTTMIGAGLAGCGPSQPWPALNQLHFTALTERTPSRGSASIGQPFITTMIGAGLAGCGPSQPWPALDQLHFTAPTERTPSRGSASIGQPFITTMIGAGLIGQERPAVRRNDHRCRPGGLRSLAAVAGPESIHFTAPTERTPSRGSASKGVHFWLHHSSRRRGNRPAEHLNTPSPSTRVWLVSTRDPPLPPP